MTRRTIYPLICAETITGNDWFAIKLFDPQQYLVQPTWLTVSSAASDTTRKEIVD